MVKFTGLPWPPTQNNSLLVSRGRLIKSSLRREFDAEMERWAWKNAKSLQEAYPFVKEAKFLGVSLEFCAEAKRFLTLDGRSKRIDVDNRIKASVDAVFKLLNCDDSKVWSLTSRKLIVPKGEFITVKILDLDNQQD